MHCLIFSPFSKKSEKQYYHELQLLHWIVMQRLLFINKIYIRPQDDHIPKKLDILEVAIC